MELRTEAPALLEALSDVLAKCDESSKGSSRRPAV